MQVETLIVGGGLAGLSVAASLQAQGEDYVLLEARPSLGGRIYSEHWAGADYDLGAAWFWPQVNPRLKLLAEQFGLGIFPQYQRGGMIFQAASGFIHRQSHSWAQSPQPMRFRAGTQALTRALTAMLVGERIRLSTVVQRLSLENGGVQVGVQQDDSALGPAFSQQFSARRVVLALAPRLSLRKIQYSPALPVATTRQLQDVNTWMASHAKAVAVYPQAFWRQQRLSGLAISQCGPLAEVHDASPATAEVGALFGFFAWPAAQRWQHREGLAQAVSKQLGQLFGQEGAKPLKLYIQDWSQQDYTTTPLDLEGQARHPEGGGAVDLTESAWQSRLFFAGSEFAASENAGYLEGALEAAERCIRQLTLSSRPLERSWHGSKSA